MSSDRRDQSFRSFASKSKRAAPSLSPTRRWCAILCPSPKRRSLVLQAGAIGEGGEIFILDMGEPVRILDLAKDTITLSGLKPYEDIEIVFTGMRPGEKLFEELESPVNI